LNRKISIFPRDEFWDSRSFFQFKFIFHLLNSKKIYKKVLEKKKLAKKILFCEIYAMMNYGDCEIYVNFTETKPWKLSLLQIWKSKKSFQAQRFLSIFLKKCYSKKPHSSNPSNFAPEKWKYCKPHFSVRSHKSSKIQNLREIYRDFLQNEKFIWDQDHPSTSDGVFLKARDLVYSTTSCQEK